MSLKVQLGPQAASPKALAAVGWAAGADVGAAAGAQPAAVKTKTAITKRLKSFAIFISNSPSEWVPDWGEAFSGKTGFAERTR